jgi:hypothetical protein
MLFNCQGAKCLQLRRLTFLCADSLCYVLFAFTLGFSDCFATYELILEKTDPAVVEAKDLHSTVKKVAVRKTKSK